jgi:uncharacterized membrane protein
MFAASKHIQDYLYGYAMLITLGLSAYWILFISETVEPLLFILYWLPAGFVAIFILWALIAAMFLLELAIAAMVHIKTSLTA